MMPVHEWTGFKLETFVDVAAVCADDYIIITTPSSNLSWIAQGAIICEMICIIGVSNYVIMLMFIIFLSGATTEGEFDSTSWEIANQHDAKMADQCLQHSLNMLVWQRKASKLE